LAMVNAFFGIFYGGASRWFDVLLSVNSRVPCGAPIAGAVAVEQGCAQDWRRVLSRCSSISDSENRECIRFLPFQ